MISASKLEYQYPGGPLIRFPALVLGQGDVLVVRGISGSGKSTWLALVAGLLAPSKGDLLVAGQSPSALAPSACDAWRARTIGFLPQKLHLSQAVTVRQNLRLVFYAAGLPENASAIDRVLTELGVLALQHRKPLQLSGGQAQRVALARCVLLNPKLLLADEPSASLDDDAAAQAIELLCSTAKALRASLVVATHDARALQILLLSQASVLQLDASSS